MIMPEVIIIVFGLLVGSFLNVCIHRIPREQSIVSPPSACPGCGSRIRPWDNIPLISYFILLRGKCRACESPISLRYPLVEAANAALYFYTFMHFGPGWHLPLLWLFVSAMIVIICIDIDFQIIPDVITLPGMPLGLFAASFLLPDPFLTFRTTGGGAAFEIVGISNSLIGLALGFGLFYLIALLSRGGMGGGDIKMMGMVGAFLGWKGVLLTTFIGSLTGALVGIALMAASKAGRKTKIPFGPYLALGSLISLFFGAPILRWYLGT
ncbi:MAG: leader peptidase (prepilin peptidase) / N-methyltransferase [Nitrospirae bacterium]|nr:MAG: leader peptidase (prepilin peptidase) / N-methyltransferase [Nitrospirota bacterium]